MPVRNEDLIARNSVLDGIAMRWEYNGHENHQLRYHRIVQMLQEESGWAETDIRNYIKYSRIKSGKREGGELSALFVGGKLVSYLPQEWLSRSIRNVTEVQVKCYLIDAYEGAHNAFVNGVWSEQEGKYVAGFYGPSGNRGRNEPGARGLTLGSDKSGLHITANRYRGMRTHVESHVKGAVLRGIVDAVLKRPGNQDVLGTSSKVFQEVQYEAALRGGRRVLSATRSRGIPLTDHFQGVSYISWLKPIHERGYDLLDSSEEKLSSATREKYGTISADDGQLPLDLSE